MTSRSTEALQQLFASRIVVELSDIQAALCKASRATAFRYLRQIPYRRSCNKNGRYYTLHDPARYDKLGLLSHQGILFSRDGSLTATVVRLVREAEAGRTEGELRELLRVRVQPLLLAAVRRGAIDRERMEAQFVYVDAEPAARQAQLERRKSLLAAAAAEAEVTDAMVIQVLLTLLRHPGAKAAEVQEHLQEHSPGITRAHVRAVFDRYELDSKGGTARCGDGSEAESQRCRLVS